MVSCHCISFRFGNDENHEGIHMRTYKQARTFTNITRAHAFLLQVQEGKLTQLFSVQPFWRTDLVLVFPEHHSKFFLRFWKWIRFPLVNGSAENFCGLLHWVDRTNIAHDKTLVVPPYYLQPCPQLPSHFTHLHIFIHDFLTHVSDKTRGGVRLRSTTRCSTRTGSSMKKHHRKSPSWRVWTKKRHLTISQTLAKVRLAA